MNNNFDFEAIAVFPYTHDNHIRHVWPILRDAQGKHYRVDNLWGPREIRAVRNIELAIQRDEPILLFHKPIPMADQNQFVFHYVTNKFKALIRAELPAPNEFSFSTLAYRENHTLLDLGELTLNVTREKELSPQLIDFGGRLIQKVEETLRKGSSSAEHARSLLDWAFQCIIYADLSEEQNYLIEKKDQIRGEYAVLEETTRRILRQYSIFQSPPDPALVSRHLAESTRGQFSDYLKFNAAVEKKLSELR